MRLLFLASFVDTFLEGYEHFIEYIALFVTHTIELVGILIIAFGAFRSIFNHFRNAIKKKDTNIKIALGNCLALGLEFKMGAEIIKTVVARNMEELAILGVIIGLRAILALLIHWEIKTERKEAELEKLKREQLGDGSHQTTTNE